MALPDLSEELRSVAERLRDLCHNALDDSTTEALESLEGAAIAVERAWSGSSLGYHANVYYADFQPPPPGAHFSAEWGFLGKFQGTTGDWREYSTGEVREEIAKQANSPDLTGARSSAQHVRLAVEEAKATIESILRSWLADHEDQLIISTLDGLDKIRILTNEAATAEQIPRANLVTRDTTALNQGYRSAPHQAVLGEVIAIRSSLSACEQLAALADRAAAHMTRMDHRFRRRDLQASGTMVFIGHGRSLIWRELKDFIEGRLGLASDEFNRVPVAGVTNVERLLQMMDDAAIALVVLTAEDEQADGRLVARQNVIHEAGLFQGRLGFSRAIVLLEEGCEEFSNIAGLGQIRFPPGQISAVFEDIRRFLDREGVLGAPDLDG